MSPLSDALLFPLFPKARGCTPRSAVWELQEAESGERRWDWQCALAGVPAGRGVGSQACCTPGFSCSRFEALPAPKKPRTSTVQRCVVWGRNCSATCLGTGCLRCHKRLSPSGASTGEGPWHMAAFSAAVAAFGSGSALSTTWLRCACGDAL